jgi:hypothetical protein
VQRVALWNNNSSSVIVRIGFLPSIKRLKLIPILIAPLIETMEQHNVYHEDIHPSQFVKDSNEIIRIVDFGHVSTTHSVFRRTNNNSVEALLKALSGQTHATNDNTHQRTNIR